ncbi:MAG: flagellar motor switch protein FliG [Treponema sp.]|jgi:flagellar motor switch protein FliG|nr:flagellar motor switch protein FliG [Treponema sp.]
MGEGKNRNGKPAGHASPREKAGFIKTRGPSSGEDSKYRRVAKFLILIGSERAADILSRLDTAQVEAISKEIASVKSIGAEEGRAVLEEFRSLLSAPYGYSGGVTGGTEEARRLLYAAYGPEKGEEILVRAVPETKADPFDFLADFSGEQLALLFREESPAAAALVFSRLPPKLSAAALAGVSGEKKLEIVRRIAHQAPVAPEVLDQVAAALREKARHIGGGREDGAFDGMNALAAILKSADASFGEGILKELESRDPDLGKDLKERIYTLDDIVYAADLPLQKKLASMENRDIVLLLKSKAIPAGEDSRQADEDVRRTAEAGIAFREKILSNLSQARRNDVLEEEEITGPVPRRDVEETASAFLGWFRKSREEGSILMLNDDDIIK